MHTKLHQTCSTRENDDNCQAKTSPSARFGSISSHLCLFRTTHLHKIRNDEESEMLKRREIMDWRFESGGRHAKSIINPAGIFIISRVEDQKRLPCFLGLLSWNSFCSFLKSQKQIAVFVIFSRSGTAVEFNLMDHARQKASLRETPGVIVGFQYHYSFFYQFFFSNSCSEHHHGRGS